MSFHEDLKLRMSLEELDDDSFSSDEESSELFMDKLITLKWLSLREKQLKTAIIYEHLKNEGQVIKDKVLLCQEIAELQEKLKKINQKYIHDGLMSKEILLRETIPSIISRIAQSGRSWKYSEKQRKKIKDLLGREKELTKQINVEQMKIDSIEDGISKLNQGIPDSRNTKKRKVSDVGNQNKDVLERLRLENKQVFDRTLLLAKVTHSLVAHHHLTNPSSATNDRLPPLQDICKRIVESQLEDQNHLRDLLFDIKDVVV